MLPAVFHEKYEADIGPHVFPTRKYRLVLERLLERGVLRRRWIREPEPATDPDLLRVHTEGWITKLRTGDLSVRERLLLEVPWSDEFREASWLCAGGSILAGRLALEEGLALHLGGGFHHAFADHGEGFCALNDVAIGIRALRAAGRADRALVVDLDVHHGNGSAAIFAADEDVFTFSMHQENNYPFHKPASDLDVGLPDGIGDGEYLALLRQHLPEILEGHGPKLAFYLAGADPYREDQLGGLGLTLEGLRARDDLVLQTLREAGVPVAICLAGGYALDTNDTVAIHAGTAEAAATLTSAR